MNNKVSVCIPARNEKFLKPTILDVLQKAKGDIEVLVHLDGYWPPPEEIVEDERVRYIHSGEVCGMRAGINKCVAIATGGYIFKLDGHCLLDEGFDIKLVADCKSNWILIPRRKRLDADNWKIQEVGKPDVDIELLSYPEDSMDFGGPSLTGKIWTDRIIANKDIPVEPIPASQGSAWFCPRDYFYELELMDDASYGPFWNESQELAMKSVLSGGDYCVTKNTWYAHLHKGKTHGRGFRLQESWLKQGRNQTYRYYLGDKVWHKQKYPLSFLIERFMPMPTWTEEKLNALKERERKNGWDV